MCDVQTLSPLSVSSPLCTKLTRCGERRGETCSPSSVSVRTATKLCPIRGRNLKQRFTEMGVTLLLQHPQGSSMHKHNTYTIHLEKYGLENTTQCPYDALDNNRGLIFLPFSSTELHKYSDKYRSKSP